jgi:anti-sigma factor RsiW
MSEIHDEFTDVLGAYALDAVEPDERGAIEQHLVGCPRCRGEVEQHREVVALLANAGAEAPLDLWDRIAGSLDEAPPPLDLAPLVPLAPRRRRWLAPAAAGVAAAVLIAVLGVQVRHQSQRIDRLQASMADPLAVAYERALADPAAQVVPLRGMSGVQAVVTRDGVGYLQASGLPRLADGRTYQLWGKVGNDLVSLGVLGADPTIVAFRAGSVTLLAITDETAGGVVRTSNAPLVTGLLT